MDEEMQETMDELRTQLDAHPDGYVSIEDDDDPIITYAIQDVSFTSDDQGTPVIVISVSKQ